MNPTDGTTGEGAARPPFPSPHEPGRALAAPSCGTCTIRLVDLAYRRAPWFRLVREPLRAGMLVLSRLHGIDAGAYAVRTEECRGCVRFHKAVLKERSPLFRALNRLVNPVFDALLGRIVGPKAIVEAKEHARRAMTGGAPGGF